jgi:hypothetical protein
MLPVGQIFQRSSPDRRPARPLHQFEDRGRFAAVAGAVSVFSVVDVMICSLGGDYRDHMNCSEEPRKQEKSRLANVWR